MAVTPKAPNIALRRSFQSIPPGYVIGRKSSGLGPPELIRVSDLAHDLNNSGVISSKQPYSFVEFYMDGTFTNAQLFTGPIATIDSTFPGGQSSLAVCATAPTGNVVFYLIYDLSLFLASGAPHGCAAHINFTAAATTGTVTWYNTSLLVAARTILYVSMPSSADTTFAGVSLLFVGDN